jgi:hypothetical protein
VDILILKRIVDIEFNDMTIDSNIYHDKLRVFIKDCSIADIWFSTKIPGRFSYHWERRKIDGKVYRHDNFPDPRWKGVSTFPKHFHNGSQNKAEESYISDEPASGVREFMNFIKKMLE